MEDWTSGTGQKLKVHDWTVCSALGRGGGECAIHRPTEGHMKDWPTHWREDWGGFMERICPHGIGHPAPEEKRNGGYGHGCDGCCTDPGKAQDVDGFKYRPGGMMRCCIKTLAGLWERTFTPETTSVTVREGASLSCEWCQSRLVFKDGAFEWDKTRSWYTPEAKQS